MSGEIQFSEVSVEKIDRVDKDAELSELVIDRWNEVVAEVLLEILVEPGWLLDETVFEPEIVTLNSDLITNLNTNPIESLDDFSGEEIHVRLFILRFLEIFSQKFDAPFVYRGGSLEDLEEGVRGSFSFFFDEAVKHMPRSYVAERQDPCVIALPVAAIVEYYKNNPYHRLFAEQGNDGIFSASLAVNLPYLPEELMVYFPEKTVD